MRFRSLALFALLGCSAVQTVLAEPFTADLLVRLDRVGAPALSPDGNHIAYVKMQRQHHYGDLEVIPVLERTDKPKVDLSKATEVREDEVAYFTEDAAWRQEMLAYDLE